MTDQHRETFTEKIQHVAENVGTKLRDTFHLNKETSTEAHPTSEAGTQESFGAKLKGFVTGNTETARSDNPFATSGSSLGVDVPPGSTATSTFYGSEYQSEPAHRIHSESEQLPRP
eukprot:ANDGO_03172.mRNA.1 hypothetical protein